MTSKTIKQKQYVCKKNLNNSNSNCRKLHKVINITLTLTLSIKATINQTFNDIFLRIINTNQMFTLIINIKAIIKVAIISTIKIIIKTLIITFKISIVSIIKR